MVVTGGNKTQEERLQLEKRHTDTIEFLHDSVKRSGSSFALKTCFSSLHLFFRDAV